MRASFGRPASGDRRTGTFRAAAALCCCAALSLLCCSTATAVGPALTEESVTAVGSSAATLQARIAPNGGATSVYFQYSTASTDACTAATCASVPGPPGAAIGATGEVEVPGETVQDLSPSPVYHYRVVALSRIEVNPGETETEEFDGADRTFTTQTAGAFALPDGRQWELVSPLEKQGALIASQSESNLSEGDLVQAAADGDAITYVAYTPTEADPSGNAGSTQVFSARGPDGWRSWDLMNVPHELATGASVGKGNEYRFFSEDLSQGILQPFGAFDPALAPEEASEQTAFLHTDYLNGDPEERCEEQPAARCYRPLVTATNLPGVEFGEQERCPPELICGPEFEGATPDASHIVLRIAPKQGPTLYEWSAGALQFVSGNGELGTFESNDPRHAISDDGSRVFVMEEADNAATGRLVMSEPARGKTLELDSHETGCSGCGSGKGIFQDASSDGSRVFFTDTNRLTEDSGAKTIAGEEFADLYECDIVEVGGEPKCVLSDLTPRNSMGESADVQGAVLGESEDGSWVYFVADGVLENEGKPVSGAVHGTCNDLTLPPGALCNLYVRHNGETSLVAVIAGSDRPDWGGGGGEANSVDLQDLVASVSPNGRWLAFMSQRELTGYDNRDAVSGRPDEEVYLYDADTRTLVCASCNPTGARPHGERYDVEETELPSMPLVSTTVWEPASWLAASLPGWTKYRLNRAAYQPRFLSDNGRLFFDSDDALVPQDVNDNWDVYEYEPPRVGSCATTSPTFSERSGGCVGLISSGTFSGESAFMDASASGGREGEGNEGEGEGNEGGGDVFFITAAQLVPQDTEDALNVYDAHECSVASPCPPAPVEQPPPCASADACRGAPSPQPSVFGAPASATFSGSGNDSPPPAADAKTAAQVKAEELAKAIRACRTRKRRKKRAACEASARARYGTGDKAVGKKQKTGKASSRRGE